MKSNSADKEINHGVRPDYDSSESSFRGDDSDAECLTNDSLQFLQSEDRGDISNKVFVLFTPYYRLRRLRHPSPSPSPLLM